MTLRSGGLTRAQVAAMQAFPYASGSVISTISSGTNTVTLSSNVGYLFPIEVRYQCVASGLQIAIGVSTPGVNGKMALYSMNGNDSRLMAEGAAAFSMGGSANDNVTAAFASNVALPPGLYAAISKFDGVAQPWVVAVNTIGTGGMAQYFGQPSVQPFARAAGAAAHAGRVTVASGGTYADANFPASFGALTVGTNAPGSPILGIVVA